MELLDEITGIQYTVPPILRTITLKGISRALDYHALHASSSRSSHTIRSCANALREIARDESINPLFHHVVINEITELMYGI